jgi:hypothetical protein
MTVKAIVSRKGRDSRWRMKRHERVAFQSTTHGFLVKPHEVVVPRFLAAASCSRFENKKRVDR